MGRGYRALVGDWRGARSGMHFGCQESGDREIWVARVHRYYD